MGIAAFLLGCVLQCCLVFVQRRGHLVQVQKSYGIGIDTEIKMSTPTMGGVVFVFLALCALTVQWNLEALLFWTLPIACGAIGFIDDWLKISHRSSEGFSSLRKLKVQVAVAVVWVVWAQLQKGIALWPGLHCSFLTSMPLAVLAVVGMMNAVNVTDGLDGLAGGMFVVSLSILGYLIPQRSFNFEFIGVLFAAAASFLLFNARPACVFMGDTGSHFLGGALAALCVQNGMILALVPAGFMFGVELLSSAIQIVAIRKFGKKIFRMAPLHHHFQRMGWDETTVTMRFLVIHAFGAALLAVLCVQALKA